MKLGGRMLAKYPGITLVGGIAMAFAIWFGTVTFEMLGLVVNPKLPLPGGDRIVQVFNWDAKESVPEKRSVHDFLDLAQGAPHRRGPRRLSATSRATSRRRAARPARCRSPR